MRERYVTDPDGMRWIVGPVLPLGVPRYRGYRFGMARPDDPAPRTPQRQQNEEPEPTDEPRRATRRRRRSDDGAPSIPLPRIRWRGGGGGGRSGGGVRSGGGGSASARRGGSAGARRGGSASASRGGGAVGALGGLGALLWTVGKWVLIVAGVIAATLLTIFVILPGIAFLAELAVVGAVIVWRTLTGRQWTVRAREDRPAPNVREWQVSRFTQARRAADEVAAALARGVDPVLPGPRSTP